MISSGFSNRSFEASFIFSCSFMRPWLTRIRFGAKRKGILGLRPGAGHTSRSVPDTIRGLRCTGGGALLEVLEVCPCLFHFDAAHESCEFFAPVVLCRLPTPMPSHLPPAGRFFLPPTGAWFSRPAMRLP